MLDRAKFYLTQPIRARMQLLNTSDAAPLVVDLPDASVASSSSISSSSDLSSPAARADAYLAAGRARNSALEARLSLSRPRFTLTPPEDGTVCVVVP